MWGMTLRVMRDEGGFKALYRGLVPTAFGVAPYVGQLCLRSSVSLGRTDDWTDGRQGSTSHHTSF